jgi:hypothetical protein
MVYKPKEVYMSSKLSTTNPTGGIIVLTWNYCFVMGFVAFEIQNKQNSQAYPSLIQIFFQPYGD